MRADVLNAFIATASAAYQKMQLVMYDMTPISGQADRECGPAASEVLVAIIADGRRIHILSIALASCWTSYLLPYDHLLLP